jgi:hypothetical protein
MYFLSLLWTNTWPVQLTNLHLITLNISGTCPCKCHEGSRGIAPSTHTETQHQLQYHLHTGWVRPTARLTLLEHRNISFLSGNQTLNQSACSPLTVTAPSNINDKYKLWSSTLCSFLQSFPPSKVLIFSPATCSLTPSPEDWSEGVSANQYVTLHYLNLLRQ